MSLDGFIARKDGGLDWLKTVEREGEDYGYAEFAKSVDVLVMGRGTYDVVRGFPEWPYGDKRVVVLTHRPSAAKFGEEFFSGTPRELVTKLAAEGVKRAYVDGGKVIQSFLRDGLISDLTISVIPVLLGEGLPLFGPEVAEKSLKLISCRNFESGLVQLSYEVAR